MMLCHAALLPCGVHDGVMRHPILRGILHLAMISLFNCVFIQYCHWRISYESSGLEM